MPVYLTPNQRMATFLGKNAIAISDWCEQQYINLRVLDSNYPQRLTIHQSLVLWEQVIRESSVGQSLLNTNEMAHLAADAWRLSYEWRLNTIEPSLQTQNTEVYGEWASCYQEKLHQINACDTVMSLDYLIEKINDQKSLSDMLSVDHKILQLPQEIHWVGFEEIIPQYADLWEALEKNNIILKKKYLTQKKGNHFTIAVNDSKHELMVAAHQVKRWISKAPEDRIGIVVPDLQSRREAIVQVFKHVLAEQAFTVSAPLALDQYSFIKAAFLGIEFMMQSEPVSIEWFSRLLTNPFFGSAQSQMNERAAFDLSLRALGYLSLSFQEVLEKNKDFLEFKWGFSLEEYACYQQSLTQKKTADEWVYWIEGVLKCLGWPGERTLDPLEVALQNQWQTLLQRYQDLGSLLGSQTLQETLIQIKVLAKQTLFSIEPMDHWASIQVLGLLEAAGLPFDRLWVMGMDQEQWPLKPAPNPFISFSVQRFKNMPRSSVAREYEMAERLTTRLMEQADEVIFSYRLARLDQPLQMSSLLQNLPKRSLMDLGLESVPISYLASLSEIKPWNTVMTEAALPLKPGHRLKGGVRTLQLQALCPFRAFAFSRLRAEPLKSVKLGLSGQERGRLVHQVLEYFWKTIPDQVTLLGLSELALNTALKQAIEKACGRSTIKQRLQGVEGVLERQRLQGLLTRLIWHEKQRPSFKVVALEQAINTELQGLKISMRVDRVDEVLGVGAVLIDYKTGTVSLSDWFSERLSDPQLPFYAQVYASDQQIQPIGLAFALMNADRVGFKGVLEQEIEDTPWPGMKPLKKFESHGAETTWAIQQAVWKTRIETLALEFAQGVAKVEPLEGSKTCRTCAFKILCRVQPNISPSGMPLF